MAGMVFRSVGLSTQRARGVAVVPNSLGRIVRSPERSEDQGAVGALVRLQSASSTVS